ncbi:uncharacterized protein LOC113851999 [Abrus precatorius]|uniref:Uncharacterized protein LOC113851999 n=1 Tax=Abrus precatorius TaxID=3816 RepID=A0A8B8K323_ABRPR|nr:uncharacterized protein LOC113851999 [Abrus precatorius]
MVKDCLQSRITCSNCGKLRHAANVCWAAKRGDSTSTAQRPELRGSTGQKSSIPGRVFAISGAEASQLLNVLFYSGATYSFVSVDCVKSLNLYITELLCNVVVTTPTSNLVMMSWYAPLSSSALPGSLSCWPTKHLPATPAARQACEALVILIVLYVEASMVSS